MALSRRFLVVIFFCITSLCAEACPMCNIHNYMYYSVKSSKEIYLLDFAQGKSKKMKIIKVIKGNHKVGDLIPTYFMTPPTTRPIVYCEKDFAANYHGLYFESYDERDIPEIEWILKGDSILHTDQEALNGILGISSEYTGLSLQYIRNNYERLLPSLIRIADSLNSIAKYKGDGNGYYQWRISNLNTAIFGNSNNSVKEYAQKWISIYTEEQLSSKAKIRWSPLRPYAPAGDFFFSLLEESSFRDSSLGRFYSEELQKRIPSLGEEAASSVFLALMASGYLDPYVLETKITPEQHDAFALAVFRFNGLMLNKNEDKYYTLALKYVHNKELKERMEYLLNLK